MSDNILTFHLTDQKLYNNYDYVMKAQISIGNSSKEISEQSEKLVKELLHIADFMSKLKIPSKLNQEILNRRKDLDNKFMAEENKKTK